MAYQVVSWVLECAPRGLRPSETLVAMVLAEYAADDGTHAFPSVPALAERSRLGERTVQMALRELLRQQVIAVESQATNKLPTMYCFPLYGGAIPAPHRGANGAPQENPGVQNTAVGVQSTALGVQSTTSRGAESAHYPPVEPSVEPPEEPPGSGASAPKTAPVTSRKKKITTTLPVDWDQQQNWDELYEWAHKELGMMGPAVDRETDKFVDHWRSNAEEKADWLATWRNWMRRSREPPRRR